MPPQKQKKRRKAVYGKRWIRCVPFTKNVSMKGWTPTNCQFCVGLPTRLPHRSQEGKGRCESLSRFLGLHRTRHTHSGMKFGCQLAIDSSQVLVFSQLQQTCTFCRSGVTTPKLHRLFCSGTAACLKYWRCTHCADINSRYTQYCSMSPDGILVLQSQQIQKPHRWSQREDRPEHTNLPRTAVARAPHPSPKHKRRHEQVSCRAVCINTDVARKRGIGTSAPKHQ